MDFKEFQQTIIERCKMASACEPEYKRLLKGKDTPDFVKVLICNQGWCMENGIFTAKEMESLPADILQEADLATADACPIDFSRPAELAGVIWEPFNIGADESNPYGDLMDFHKANIERVELRVPTNDEFVNLANTGSKWAIYNGVFGRLFGGKVFLPAAGNRSYSTGAVFNQGTNGYFWSSVPNSAAYGYYLSFTSSRVYPVDYDNYANGFAVRCVRL